MARLAQSAGHAIPSLALLAAFSVLTPAQAATERGIEVRVRQGAAADSPVETVRLYGASLALVIGIDEYTNGWPRLSNGVNDARAVAAELEKRGFEVTLKTDLDSVALKRTFEEFFVINGADPEARLFVWFSGHGATVGGEAFLVPANAPLPQAGPRFKLSALSLRRFGEFMRLAESKHAFTVFDSCFAGTIFDVQRTVPPAAITRATTLPVRQFLTSGDAGETVSDDGTFRKLFIRALRGEEQANANGDGYLTASELGMFLSDRMVNLRLGQTPRYGKLRDPDFDQGDFVFRTLASLEGGEPLGAGGGARPVSEDTRARLDLAFWESVKDSGDRTMIEAYLEQFPEGTFAAIARRELESTRPAEGRSWERSESVRAIEGEWNEIKASTDIQVFRRFLRRHPYGKYHALALRRLIALGGERLPEQRTASVSNQAEGRSVSAIEREWNEIKDATDIQVLRRFLRRYPYGKYHGLALGRLNALDGERQSTQRTASVSGHPFDGQWYMKLTCSHGGYWESLVTVENGKIDHNVRWDSNDRLILNGSFDRNGELNIEGRLIFIDHGAQRTWAKAKGRGGKADGWGTFGGYGGCEFVANRQ